MYNKYFNNAFSLVELMISLITVSLVTAAFAPVITKKLSRSMVTVKSAVAAIRSDCSAFNDNGGTCNACINDSCLLCDIHCDSNQYKNIGKCLCENCSERSEGCLECSSQGCDKCADGYYIDKSLKCVKCPAGSRCPNGKRRELCPIGYFQDEEKKTVCKSCLTKNGNYSDTEGSIACLACIAGQYATDNDNNWSASENINGTQCLTCPLGWKCSDGKNPIACASGAYQDEAGKTDCKSCSDGTYSPNSPSSSCSACNNVCATCSQSATACTTCNSGYTLSNGVCIIAHAKPACEEQAVCSFSGDMDDDWMLTIKASTRVAFTSEEEVDVFAVGGGGAGAGRGNGTGGCGGYTKTIKNIILSGSYVATIGAGGKGGGDWSGGGAGGTTSLGNIISAAGGGGGVAQVQQKQYSCKGGSGGGGWRYDGAGCNGVGGSDGGNGCGPFNGTGQGTTTRAFGENTTDLYAGGGGSEGWVSGGAGGGGGTAASGTPNTGGGGGAYGADGGSGVILIRNARWKY